MRWPLLVAEKSMGTGTYCKLPIPVLGRISMVLSMVWSRAKQGNLEEWGNSDSQRECPS